MNPVYLYTQYIAIKSHLQGKYDYFKYGGKTNISRNPLQSFKKRRDQKFFCALAKKLTKDEAIPCIVANELYNDGAYWLSDTNRAYDVYLQYRTAIESVQYNFKNDIENLLDVAKTHEESLTDVFDVKDSKRFSRLLYQYLAGQLSATTFVILDRMLGLISKYNVQLHDNIVWKEESVKLVAYKQFLPKWDMTPFKKTLAKLVKDML